MYVRFASWPPYSTEVRADALRLSNLSTIWIIEVVEPVERDRIWTKHVEVALVDVEPACRCDEANQLISQPDLFKLKCITRKRAGAFFKIKIVNGCRVHLSLFKYRSQPAQCLNCHLIGRIAAQELNAALNVEKIPPKTPVIVRRSSLFHFWKVMEEHNVCSVEI